jgi:hypothetical protein
MDGKEDISTTDEREAAMQTSSSYNAASTLERVLLFKEIQEHCQR